MHAEIGIGNYFLNSFFEWIDYRVEEISEEEREKRNLYGNNFDVVYKSYNYKLFHTYQLSTYNWLTYLIFTVKTIYSNHSIKRTGRLST